MTMNRTIAIFLVLAAGFFPGSVFGKGKIRVACIGNSVTYGYTLEDPATESYPAVLQRWLGEGYDVENFGHSGATLLRHGHNPYDLTPEFARAVRFRADIAVIDAQIENAKATIAQREAALKVAELDLERTLIVSPIDGTVISRTIRRPETLGRSTS